MCGIAGVMLRGAAVPPPELDELAVMAGALSHRGPDEFGLYRDRQADPRHHREVDHIVADVRDLLVAQAGRLAELGHSDSRVVPRSDTRPWQ